MRSSPSTRFGPKQLQRAAPDWVFVGLAFGMMAMTALHFVQPALDAIEEPVSFYVHGTHGWLLPLALVAFGLASIGLSLAFGGAVPRRSRRSLAIFGSGMVAMALLPSDSWFPWEADPSASGLVHSAVATIAPLFLVDPMIASVRERETGSYRTVFWLVIGYVVGLAGSAISLIVGFALDLSPPLIGLAERALALIALAWVGVLAWQVRPPSE